MKVVLRRIFRFAESILLRDHPRYKNPEGYLHLVEIPFNVSKWICPEFHEQIIDAELTTERRVDLEYRTQLRSKEEEKLSRQVGNVLRGN